MEEKGEAVDKMACVSLENAMRSGTSRGLDFITLSELTKRTGVSTVDILKWAVLELLCNSLDKEDSTVINISVTADGYFDVLTVSDNGSRKITRKEIEMILDFQHKASTKRGFHRVSRGYLGNALKCVFGYSYVLPAYVSNAAKPRPVMIVSGGFRYTIELQPDFVREVINSSITVENVEDDGLTTITVSLARYNFEVGKLRETIFATSLVNPNRKITYNLFGDEGELGLGDDCPNLRRETSVLWYDCKQFSDLFSDFVRSVPETKIKEFLPLFRGFTGTIKCNKILKKLNDAGNHNHDSYENRSDEFLPTTPIKDFTIDDIHHLYSVMVYEDRSITKPSIPRVLGTVGRDSLEKFREKMGWRRLRYTAEVGIKRGEYATVEYPFIVELAVFDRKEDDTEGLKVYQCVNFAASMEDIFSKIFDVSFWLSSAGISREMAVTVICHLICPVLKWLNYGKSGLDE